MRAAEKYREGEWEELDEAARVQILALPRRCTTLGKVPNLSMPQVP